MGPAGGEGHARRSRRFLDQAIEERQPMVLWYRVMGILPQESPWVREGFATIWPGEWSTP
jgi:hypothetical protein